MYALPNTAAFEQRHSALPVATRQAGNAPGQPGSVTRKTIDKVDEMLGASGASLVYAGYPYDPAVPGAPRY